MTQYEIDTLAILRASKLRSRVNGTKIIQPKLLARLESMPSKPTSLPVTTVAWRTAKLILIEFNALDKEDDVFGPFDSSAVWKETFDGQMVKA